MKQNKELSEIAEYTSPIISTDHPNQPLYILREEEFLIKTETGEIIFVGSIAFKWFPQIGVYVEGATKDFKFLEGQIKDFKVFKTNGDFLGDAIAIQEKYIKNQYFIKGIFSFDCLSGDTTIPVNEVRFSIPNMQRFDGQNIRSEEIGWYKGRIFLKLADYDLNIDKLPDFGERIAALKDVGGYHITYSGKMTFKTPKSLQDMKKEIQVLNCFLQLLSGIQISALFFSGVNDRETLWTDYRSAGIDSYHQRGSSCFPRYFLEHSDFKAMEIVYSNLIDFWRKDDYRNMISSAVKWYSEANSKPWYHSTTSMIISQSALEMFYNWYMIEKDGILRGEVRLSAANKIRLLLSRIGIKNEVPQKYAEIKKFLNDPKNKNEEDAIDATVFYRNAIVHGESEKRTKLVNLSPSFKREANNLSLWYLELCLLYTLGYNGKYVNRTTIEYSSDTEKVPWASEKNDFIG
ncbi:hypothetical protein C7S20_13760 [Christiangramia fulva]|uniref:YopA central domain-containing protein n=1 Tax=Christiangramia fulva TaxID=2126553 RepID=A0A2R3Z7K7_9FLAO|nr:hypothetical protein [Christiangramia fulva]AVR46241.1 hypothetical protein C7S20_13760 [Christiangramia fulva]